MNRPYLDGVDLEALRARVDALEAMVRSEVAWLRGCVAVLEDARRRAGPPRGEPVTAAPGPGQLDDECPT